MKASNANFKIDGSCDYVMKWPKKSLMVVKNSLEISKKCKITCTWSANPYDASLITLFYPGIYNNTNRKIRECMSKMKLP